MINVTVKIDKLRDLTEVSFRSNLIDLILLLIYVIIFYFTSKKRKELNKFFTYGFCIISLVTLLPIFLIILLIFNVYRLIISSVLLKKFKTAFGGLLNGSDSFWLTNDDSNGIINVLLAIKCVHSQSVLKEILVEKFEKLNLEKLTCKWRKCGGYSFLIKNKIRIQDQIKLKEINLDQDAGRDLGDCLWEILIGDEVSNRIQVLARFHHSIGDGVSLLQLLLSLSEKQDAISIEKSDTFLTCCRICFKTMQFILVLINLPRIAVKNIFKQPEANLIHGKRLTGQKMFLYKTEPTERYVKLVKKLKKKFYNVGFLDIITTALSESLSGFFKKNCDQTESISVVIPAVPNLKKLRDLGSIKSTNEHLKNDISIGVLDLPLGGNKFSIEDRLSEVTRKLFALRKSHEYQVNYWILEIVCTILPEQVIKLIFNSIETTLVFSNLPGVKRVSLFENCWLEDVVFWIPHRGLTGAAISIFTYDNRFQLGLSLDKVYGLTEIQAQEILDGVFKSLDKLDLRLN